MAEREAMEFDVVVVGAGPAGLAAAIRLKQLAPEATVCVVEKGSEVGAHILSGAVIEPRALDELLPDWRSAGRAANNGGDRGSLPLSHREARRSACRRRRRCTIAATASARSAIVCRWLARQAEALGVEIYPGFAAAELLERGWAHRGGRDRRHGGREMTASAGRTTSRGMELRAAYTLFAEGCRGSSTQAADGPLRPARRTSIRRPTRSASRNCGRSRASSTGRGWSSTRSAGRSMRAPMAARSSIILAKPAFVRLRGRARLSQSVALAVR